MKKTLLSTAAALTLATLAVASVQAQEGPGQRGEGRSVQEAHWRGPDDHGWHRRGGHGRREGRGGSRDMFRQFQTFDANQDGAITQAEVDQFRQNQIAEFDGNNDGTLSLEEYQALWLDAMRERMVDAFQEHDDDGNGQVTAEEFNERYVDLVERFDRNGDGQLSADDRRGGRGMMRRGPETAQPDDAEPETAPEAAPDDADGTDDDQQ
jgi:Ca2+-binding EF-hand superfamily protein